MLGLGLALFLMPQVSLAEEDHIDEAIKHTKQAIVQGKMQGKMSHDESFLDHAKEALADAKASENAKANPHTEEAITHLDRAIAEVKKSHSAQATTQAEAALTHLEQAK